MSIFSKIKESIIKEKPEPSWGIRSNKGVKIDISSIVDSSSNIKESFNIGVPGKGLVKAPKDFDFLRDIGEEHPFDLYLHESSYESIPIIKGAVDKYVAFTTGADYDIESKKEGVKNHWVRFRNDFDFDVLLRYIVRDMLVYGSSFTELIWKNKTIVGLKLLDPKTMYVKRSDKGVVSGYTQVFGKNYYDKEKQITFKPEEVMHLSYNRLNNSPYGTSIIRPLYGEGDETSLIKNYLRLEINAGKIVAKIAGAKTIISMGSELRQPNQADIDRLTDKLYASRDKTEWAVPWDVKFSVLDYKNKVLDLKPFFDHLEKQMIYGLGVPPVLMGTEGVAEGLATVQLEAFERKIGSIQLAISHGLENKLFNILFGSSHNYKFVWKKKEKKDLTELNILIRYLSGKFIISMDTRLIIENRIRQLLGKPELTKVEYIKDFSDETDILKARNDKFKKGKDEEEEDDEEEENGSRGK